MEAVKVEPVLGVRLWWGDKAGVLAKISNWIERGERRKQVATVNPEFVMQALEDERFMKTLNQVDLKVVDGVGLVWARRVLSGLGPRRWTGLREGWRMMGGDKKEGLVPGVELSEGLVEKASKRGWKVLLLGGWGERAKRSAQRFEEKYPKLKIEAIPGEPVMSLKETLRYINDQSPEVLLVAYGMRKQEEWIQANKNKMDFGVALGVGRSFDYWSGDLKRAPVRIRRMGLEWLYSLYKEPKRWRRQLALIRFGARVLA